MEAKPEKTVSPYESESAIGFILLMLCAGLAIIGLVVTLCIFLPGHD